MFKNQMIEIVTFYKLSCAVRDSGIFESKLEILFLFTFDFIKSACYVLRPIWFLFSTLVIVIVKYL